MKQRKWSIAALLCLLAVLLALPAQAQEYGYVFDEAGLLTQEQAAQLDELADSFAMEYDCGVYIVTLWDYSMYGSSVRSAAENYFLTNDLGIGSDDNGVLLFLSMADRDYALIAHGKTANAAFTDYGKDVLSEEFLDNFYYDDWPGGLSSYMINSGSFLERAATGKPVDVDNGTGIGMTLVMVLLIPAAIAGITCACMVSSMKTARSKTHADDYRGQVQITGSRDQFLTRTMVRQKIESSGSSHRSGGTRVNTGGFSGKSGKF